MPSPTQFSESLPEKAKDDSSKVDSINGVGISGDLAYQKESQDVSINPETGRQQGLVFQAKFANRFIAGAFGISILVLILGAFLPSTSRTTVVKTNADGTSVTTEVVQEQAGNMWAILFGGGMAAFALGSIASRYSPEFTKYFYGRTFDSIDKATKVLPPETDVKGTSTRGIDESTEGA